MNKAECLFIKLAFEPSVGLKVYDTLGSAWRATKGLKRNIKGAIETRRLVEKGEAGIEPFKTLAERGVYSERGKKYIEDIARGFIIPAVAGTGALTGVAAYQGIKSMDRHMKSNPSKYSLIKTKSNE